ncbi:MAG: nuclease [Candidatus Marinimicrobia bacterium]|nr:nuclease [Candidatus Neomarinimicrobiota bacterium]|tara:strand:- start:2445 stop:2927 length:483 start_codon:yes stop_codon:yes gene_type:complete
MKKVSIFVDVQNIYYTTKQIYNCHFDYNAFWKKVVSDRKVVKAVAYAIKSKDVKQRQFHNILRGIGFEVKLKPYIQRIDNSAKGDWDVGITIDILEYVKTSDIIVLASGDGDFEILIKKVIEKYNSVVEVYGVKELTALSLINSASKFNPIDSDLLLKKI